VYVCPDDVPERLKRFRRESGLSWSEIARRIGAYRHTVWRWKLGRGPPQLPAPEGAAGTGRKPWPDPPLHQSSADSS